jgi:hypothetical protein
VAAAATLEPEIAPKMALATIIAEVRLPGTFPKIFSGAAEEPPDDAGRRIDGAHEDEQGDGREGEGVHDVEGGPGEVVHGLIREKHQPETCHDPHRHRDLDAEGQKQR